MGTDSASRQALCEQVAALFSIHGFDINEQVIMHMQPLFHGQDFAQHRAALAAQLEGLQA